jgi:hypothetical protein
VQCAVLNDCSVSKLFKMCLQEHNSQVQMFEHLFSTLPTQNDAKPKKKKAIRFRLAFRIHNQESHENEERM